MSEKIFDKRGLLEYSYTQENILQIYLVKKGKDVWTADRVVKMISVIVENIGLLRQRDSHSGIGFWNAKIVSHVCLDRQKGKSIC